MRELQWPRPLWADAICINQSDQKEKAIQVSMMGKIYSNAQTVIVWLGPAGLYTHWAVSRVSTLSDVLARTGDVHVDIDHLYRYNLPDCHEPFGMELATFSPAGGLRVYGPFKNLVAQYVWRYIADFRLLTGMILWPLSRGLQRYGLTNVPHKYHGVGGGETWELNGYTTMRTLSEIKNLFRFGRWASLNELISLSRQRNTKKAVGKVYAVVGFTKPELRQQIKLDYSLQNRQQFWNLYIDVGHLILSEKAQLDMLMLVSAAD
jgi:hypothetical protein